MFKKKIVIAMLLLSFGVGHVLAQSPSPSPGPTAEASPSPDPSQAGRDEERLRQILAEQEKAKKELSGLENQERSLKQQIEFANTQIKLTDLRIAEAKNKVAKAEADLIDLVTQIEELSTRIGRIQSTVDQLSSVLIERIRETYMRTRTSTVGLFFSAKSFGDFLARYQYLRLVQLNDRKLLYQMQATKENYTDHRDLLESKQAQVEATKTRITQEKANLESNQITLAKQKADKEALLRVTQNDEKRYREIIALLQGEARSLAKIAIVDGQISYSIDVNDLKKMGSVTAGNTVGQMGNSGEPGCSSGPHLHFETITNASLSGDTLSGFLIDPSLELRPRTLDYWASANFPQQTVVGLGSWEWPMADPLITQGYGHTPWSNRYANGFHTALDMIPITKGGDETVRAVAPGVLYSGILRYNGCSPINVRFIDHENGKYSLYWHLR